MLFSLHHRFVSVNCLFWALCLYVQQSLQSYSQPSTAQYTGQNSGRSIASVDGGWTNPSSSRTSLSAMSTPSMLSPSSSAPSSGRYSTQSGFSAPYQNPHSASGGNAPRAQYASRDFNERVSGSWTSMDASAPKSAPAAGGQGIPMHGSEDKLASAQRVIRKLYRKSIELSSSVTQIVCPRSATISVHSLPLDELHAHEFSKLMLAISIWCISALGPCVRFLQRQHITECMQSGIVLPPVFITVRLCFV